MNKINYPIVWRDEEKYDNYHGINIPNPYHWLENSDSDETKSFVKSQNTLSESFIKNGRVRNLYKERLTELWNYPKYGCPFKRGERYFYFHNTGLQNHRVLYMQNSLDSEPEIFLDPNTFCVNGSISIQQVSFSKDGNTCAYGVSSKGSDWTTIKFIDVATKGHMTDTLVNVKFSCLCWTHDNKGVFYNKYNKDESSKQDGTETDANLNQKLFYHVLGTEQSEDILIAEFPENPKWMCNAEISDDGQYIFLTISESCDPVNKLYFFDLKTINYEIKGLLEFQKIIDNFEASYDYITNNESLVTLRTNLNAPRYKLITLDLNNFSMDKWTVLVEEDEHVLEWAACVNLNFLVICYLQHVKHRLYLHHLNTGERFYELPLDVGSIIGFSGKKHQTEIFYLLTSFLIPERIYYCDFSGSKYTPKVFREANLKGFDSSLFETRQVFYSSKDGTSVPMFLIYKKGLELNGNTPCYLYGYGGFNISVTPSFNVSRLVFIQNMGGMCAVANIRGGGEYGEKWHKDGCLSKKQNVFDDFISAAEYLIENKYTKPNRLAISGGSNGGLLVTVCMNQRPDLFKCVVANVSVTDMLNFHKYTIGHAWTSEYGCSDNKEDFEFLIKYSPLHNVCKQSSYQYPALLLLTADHDDRVVPLHSYKLIAELQHKLTGNEHQENPLLIRVDTESGHGAGKPTSKSIEELSDVFFFIASMVGTDWSE
ncbi:prolyl endopeptidase isoform X1 [Hydra vulgaris]|uniref:prolyl endopeptidase isoform X1 n=1 Tax=Hydra vulgaris TaxID=6087 RepID=UPI001F5FDA8B|nr:prolyl endopeptidase isoform X1 [Hydra vulgaris]